MNFPLYIAKRYLFTKSSNNTINIITIIATVGVIIGTMALFIVLSGFSGLKEFSLNSIKTFDPDIKITAIKGKSFLFTPEIQSKINATKNVAHYTKIIEERAFFEFKNKTHLAYIKGVEEDYIKVNRIDTAVVGDGQWINYDFTNNAVIGNGISNKLSMGINNFLDPLVIYVPKAGKGYVKSIKNDISTIITQPVGIFALSEELDMKFTFIALDLAQKLLEYDSNQISAIEIKVTDINNRNTTIKNLEKVLGSDFKIQTREQLNAVFYRMLNIENLFTYAFSTLVLILFLINLIGTLIIISHDKRENMKTINSFGLDLLKIRKIFFLYGLLLTFFGLIVGLILSIIFVLLQQQFGFYMITPVLAFPILFSFKNVLIVFLTISVLSYFATKIASNRITQEMING